jgi:hypothetical protein
MILAQAAAVAFIQLTGPDGRQHIDVNPAQVTSVRDPRAAGHFAKGTKCIVFMSNGNFIAVAEDCDAVRQKLGEAKP